MRKSRHTEEQIIKVLREQEAGLKVSELCRKYGISEQTFYRWRSKYGGMSVGIFEKNHEAGGGWMTEEMSAPGFLNDCHASSTDPSYHMPVERDFPEWGELGGKYNEFEVAIVSIFLPVILLCFSCCFLFVRHIIG